LLAARLIGRKVWVTFVTIGELARRLPNGGVATLIGTRGMRQGQMLYGCDGVESPISRDTLQLLHAVVFEGDP
jgi:hypothetical protein